MKMDLSAEEMIDLISAMEMAYNKMVYSGKKIEDHEVKRCVRFTDLIARFEEFLTLNNMEDE